METELRKKITAKILAKIPSYLNPVDFLYDVLDISKESIYRRIKGEISFTLEDLIKISSRLFISMDEIVYTSLNNAPGQQPIVFQSQSDKLFNPQQTFLDFLSTYIHNLDKTSKAKKLEVMVAANRLMILTAVHYDHLFKFYYYRWIHQTQLKPLDFSLSDTVLSDSLLTQQKKLKAYKRSGTHTYILDIYFLKNTIREILYYYNRQLISDSEILLLQNDLYKFIDVMEYLIKQGDQIEGYTSYIYLSNTQIDSSGLYSKYDDKEAISLWISYGLNIGSTNVRMCKTYLSWFNSLKKYSTLISGCNEMLQIKFINQQRDYIKNITNKDYSYE
ncbi:hypothetical protein D0T84_10890 [Dysgonomonas sp. 521]|uniref:helix-turn-helix domain-containing protein n=1 Tax=Dysgonomonas sp. 521 TaxID=2302932 RepID=UPI0013D36169|nr:helix-turn-helix domain-containing protein [Dysgonomonas sp. 521]NDV95417.1 hypothetical protein [Dysgonomonas sp. 521]